MAFEFDDTLERFKLQLSRLNEIPNIADQELKACAEEVAQKARNMAPYDYMDLIDAIQIARRGGARDARGRFVSGMSNYEVFINMRHPTQHKEAPSGTVADYAWEVHEHMGWGSTPGSIYMKNGEPFMPNKERRTGPHGEERGGRFIERALHELEHGIYARVQRKVIAHTESLDI